jgi:adenine-specific DNA-methyltransferase
MTKTEQKGDPVKHTSKNIHSKRIEKLKEIFPEVFCEGKVDSKKLHQILENFTYEGPERYAFSWVGQRAAVQILQEPPRSTLIPSPEESMNWDSTKHIFIEGDNLEVLKILLESYSEKVKMIYIDPPYNTGREFIYSDNYREPLDKYLQQTEQRDTNGNLMTSDPETSGRYHSKWLSMMYPRLFLARQLLSEDGLIFISIDDNEVHNLRFIMNEIFGEECFKNCIIFRRGIKSVQAQFDTVDTLTVGHEYILLYAKKSETRLKKLEIPLRERKPGSWNNHWRGTNRPTMRYELFGITPDTGQWRWSKERSLHAIENFQRMLQDLQMDEQEISQEQIDGWYTKEIERTGERVDLLRLSSYGKPEHYVPPTDTKLGSDLWTDLSTRGGSKLKSLFGIKVFDNPKPLGLIKRMLRFATESQKNHLILDFFAGSCTTALAVLELNREDGGNRRFMMVQLPIPIGNPIKLQNGSKLETIADIGKEAIRREIAYLQSETSKVEIAQKTGEPEDLGFRVYKSSPSYHV